MGRVFVCHSSRDRAQVEPLTRFVEAQGWKCWVAPRDVQPGVEYATAIMEALDSCSVVLFLASEVADASPQVRRELERAATLGRPILVVRLGDFPFSKSVQYYVGQHHWLEYWQYGPEEGPARIRNALSALILEAATQTTRGEPTQGGAGLTHVSATQSEWEPEPPLTRQHVPAWAWILLLAVGVWALGYVLTPLQLAPLTHTHDLADVGARVYGDTCAHCHGEDGNGSAPVVPALRDSTRALADSPYPLLAYVVASHPTSMMPAWGTQLTNEELTAVVNHVRTSWLHDSSTIALDHRSPPQGPFSMVARPGGGSGAVEHGIRQLEAEFEAALRAKDSEVLSRTCFPPGSNPLLFRADGVHARGRQEVSEAWNSYFGALGTGEVMVLQLIDVRYSYEMAQFATEGPREGTIVIAMGRLFLRTKTALGREEQAKGRFIRAYAYHQGAWSLALDFADIPMAVGLKTGG